MTLERSEDTEQSRPVNCSWYGIGGQGAPFCCRQLHEERRIELKNRIKPKRNRTGRSETSTPLYQVGRTQKVYTSDGKPQWLTRVRYFDKRLNQHADAKGDGYSHRMDIRTDIPEDCHYYRKRRGKKT